MTQPEASTPASAQTTDNQTTGNQTTWNAEQYRAQHAFVYESSRDLVTAWLSPQAGERILDVGCGTGELSAQMARTGAQVLGIDSAQSMVAAACERHPQEGLEFAVVEAHNLPYAAQFDAAFSNAALHWMNPLDTVFAGLHRALKPGGRLVLEMGGAGNVLVVRQSVEAALQELGLPALAHPWVFPSAAELAALIEGAGFTVERLHRFARPSTLSGPEGFAAWLENFGSGWLAPLSAEQRQAVIARAEELARPQLWNGSAWVADYVRLRALAWKE